MTLASTQSLSLAGELSGWFEALHTDQVELYKPNDVYCCMSQMTCNVISRITYSGIILFSLCMYM